MRSAVLGAGSWGTTVASPLAGRRDCTVWAASVIATKDLDVARSLQAVMPRGPSATRSTAS
jgi:glycerol-3-phosphate dehydrogenase